MCQRAAVNTAGRYLPFWQPPRRILLAIPTSRRRPFVLPAPSTVKGDMPHAGECSIADSWVAFSCCHLKSTRVQQVRASLPYIGGPEFGCLGSCEGGSRTRADIGMLRYCLYSMLYLMSCPDLYIHPIAAYLYPPVLCLCM